MDIEQSKFLSSQRSSNPNQKMKYLYKILFKMLITVILFIITLIVCKSSDSYKTYIYKKLYNNAFSFTEINNLYNKYLGGIIPLEKIIKTTEPVFNEKLKYKDETKYYDGVSLTTDKNYLVPILESGIVVFSGVKENYGNTVIIQGMDGVDIWYGNLSNTSVKIYDYVEGGNPLGEVIGDKLYLVFGKDNKYYKYEEYLSKY